MTEEGKENKLEIEIEGEKKAYGPEDIQNLVAQQAEATKKTQKVAAISAILEKHGMDAEEYLQQTEGAFHVLNKLVDAGMIDEEGNVLDKKEPLMEPPPKKSPLPDDETGYGKRLATVEKALQGVTDGLTRTQEETLRTQQLVVANQILSEFPDLAMKDVGQLFALAKGDQTKSLREHAEGLIASKKSEKGKQREEYAKEFGINLKEFDENKLNEQSGDGGAGALYKNKKFKLRKTKDDGDDIVTPRKATEEFFNKNL